MFNEGDKVRVPNPDDDGTILATFLSPGEQSDAVTVDAPGVEGGTVKRDVAWVRYGEGNLEGTTGKHLYEEITAA